MEIGIDISQIVYGSGVSNYVKNLVKTILKNDNLDHYKLFAGSFRRKGELEQYINNLEGNFKSYIYPIPPTLADNIWNNLHILPIERFIGRIDVFHSSDWTQPPSKSYKVTTIHDLVPIIHPEYSDPHIVTVSRRRFKHIKKEVDKIIVPSEATKTDLIGLGIDQGKIVIIPEAPDEDIQMKDNKEIENFKAKYKITGKYLLAIGVTARKNIDRIIDSFTSLNSSFKLVIIGHKYINISNRKNVLFLGHIPVEDISCAYSGSEVFIFPSLYEGFGIPILEAFRCRTPVVTSNVGSMVEVAGDAAILVDPYETESIKDGIEISIKNRKQLIAKGLIRLKKYSWLRSATETINLYRYFNK